jgi:hypothetical protein
MSYDWDWSGRGNGFVVSELKSQSYTKKGLAGTKLFAQ